MSRKVLKFDKAIVINDSSIFIKNKMRYKFNILYPNGIIYEVTRNSKRNLQVAMIHYETIAGISRKPITNPKKNKSENKQNWLDKNYIYDNAFEPDIESGELVSLLTSVSNDREYDDILYHRRYKGENAKYYIVRNGKLTKINKQDYHESYKITKKDKDIICIYKGSRDNKFNNYVLYHLENKSDIPIRLVYYFKKTKDSAAFMWVVGYFNIIYYDILKDDNGNDIYTFYLKYYTN